jgi:hypothetical protein
MQSATKRQQDARDQKAYTVEVSLAFARLSVVECVSGPLSFRAVRDDHTVEPPLDSQLLNQ